jgi:hypothetical protein
MDGGGVGAFLDFFEDGAEFGWREVRNGGLCGEGLGEGGIDGVEVGGWFGHCWE